MESTTAFILTNRDQTDQPSSMYNSSVLNNLFNIWNADVYFTNINFYEDSSTYDPTGNAKFSVINPTTNSLTI